jgi:hypothetical protein
MAHALGVSVDELLRAPAANAAGRSSTRAPRGHVQRLFDAVTKLPRRQQRRIIDVLEALLAQAGSGAAPGRAA